MDNKNNIKTALSKRAQILIGTLVPSVAILIPATTVGIYYAVRNNKRENSFSYKIDIWKQDIQRHIEVCKILKGQQNIEAIVAFDNSLKNIKKEIPELESKVSSSKEKDIIAKWKEFKVYLNKIKSHDFGNLKNKWNDNIDKHISKIRNSQITFNEIQKDNYDLYKKGLKEFENIVENVKKWFDDNGLEKYTNEFAFLTIKSQILLGLIRDENKKIEQIYKIHLKELEDKEYWKEQVQYLNLLSSMEVLELKHIIQFEVWSINKLPLILEIESKYSTKKEFQELLTEIKNKNKNIAKKVQEFKEREKRQFEFFVKEINKEYDEVVKNKGNNEYQSKVDKFVFSYNIIKTIYEEINTPENLAMQLKSPWLKEILEKYKKTYEHFRDLYLNIIKK
ncbi:hypothetical protein DMC14_001485 [Metamycoplasma phocicerebrale]|uniref:Uncharacterized protein n=1 Tax=Metamycoplasma phocicerebrale TaxID=142649 RepID=A0A3T0TU16_9BACT|nr:hypothetical protein [Metamycoplasma phocicerebrale]AZZ65459.1 hypothetical protein DMC14_001485 [Metamycoplasma phocicerebrale]